MKESKKTAFEESILPGSLTRRKPRYLPFSLLLFFALASAPLYAYTDPGAGSLAVQAIIAGFLGAMLALKIYWKKLAAFCAGLFKKKDDSPEK